MTVTLFILYFVSTCQSLEAISLNFSWCRNDAVKITYLVKTSTETFLKISDILLKEAQKRWLLPEEDVMQSGCLLTQLNKMIEDVSHRAITSAVILSNLLLLPYALASGQALADLTEFDTTPLKDNSGQKELLTPESFRISIPLHSPRRFATRFLKKERLFQLRVYPAKTEDFRQTQFFDTRCVTRAIVEEKNNEVTVSFQLKNLRISWLVTTQERPWRIVVDFWNSDAGKRPSLEEQWNWLSDDRYLASKAAKHEGSLENQPMLESSENQAKVDTGGNFLEVPSITESEESGLKRPASELNHGAEEFPPGFGPLKKTKKADRQSVTSLEREVGNKVGTLEEYDANENLAHELFDQGAFESALRVFRKLPVISERRFLESDKTLLVAAEAAYLSKKFDSSSDYTGENFLKLPCQKIRVLQ